MLSLPRASFYEPVVYSISKDSVYFHIKRTIVHPASLRRTVGPLFKDTSVTCEFS